MTDEQHTREAAIALVDGLSSPRNEVKRRDLTLVKLREIAIDAAQQGFCEVELGHRDRAAGAVAKVAEELIVAPDDRSPDGWARKGARDGILSMWEGAVIYPPPLEGLELELYTVAFAAAAAIVRNVITAEHARRAAEEKRS